MTCEIGCRLPTKHEGTCDKRVPMVLRYKNWKGVIRVRTISPTGQLMWGKTEFHQEEQWLLGAICHDDGKHKLFALDGFGGAK